MVDLLPICMCLLMHTNVYFDSHKNLRKHILMFDVYSMGLNINQVLNSFYCGLRVCRSLNISTTLNYAMTWCTAIFY